MWIASEGIAWESEGVKTEACAGLVDDETGPGVVAVDEPGGVSREDMV